MATVISWMRASTGDVYQEVVESYRGWLPDWFTNGSSFLGGRKWSLSFLYPLNLILFPIVPPGDKKG